MTAVSCGPIPRPRSGWASRPGTCARAISPVCRRFARTSPRSSNRPVRHSAPWWPWDARSARAALRPARPLVGRDPDAHALGPAAPGTGGQGLAGTGSGLRAHARPRAQEPAGERTRRRPADPAGKQSRCGRGTGPGHHPGRRPDHPARRSLEPGRRYPPGRAQRGQSQPSRGQRHGQPDPRRRIREGDPEGRFRPGRFRPSTAIATCCCRSCSTCSRTRSTPCVARRSRRSGSKRGSIPARAAVQAPTRPRSSSWCGTTVPVSPKRSDRVSSHPS